MTAVKVPAVTLYGLQPPPREAPLLLAIGSSTGGPNALMQLVRALVAPLRVPIVLTQHMPGPFICMLAETINRLGILPCAVARDGDRLRAGGMIVAAGNRHLLVNRDEKGLFVTLSAAPPAHYCRPAVDPMLLSATEATGGRVLAAILTGMGQDGVAGVRALVARGGAAIVQDEASSVVWGMPGSVARAGLAHAVLPLPQIGPKILTMLRAVR